MTKDVDYKNFSKVVDLTVKRVNLTTTESPKSCELSTKSINRYHEKKKKDD